MLRRALFYGSVFFAALAVLSPSKNLLACDSASCALITRGQSHPLGKGSWQLDLSGRYTDMSVPLWESRSITEVVRPLIDFDQRRVVPAYHAETSGYESFVQIDIAYGMSARLSVLASVPLIAHRAYNHVHTIASTGAIVDPEHDHGASDPFTASRQSYGTNGIGDVLLGGRYALLVAAKQRFSAGLAVKLPTGHSRQVNAFDGTIYDPMVQPGSGAFAFVPSAQYSYRLQPLGLDCTASASYQINTENGLGYFFGNETIAAAGVSRHLTKDLTASLQIKQHHTERSRYLGKPVPSTGASFLHVSPGLRFDTPEGASIYGFLQIVVRRHVNELQLGPRMSFLIGFSKAF